MRLTREQTMVRLVMSSVFALLSLTVWAQSSTTGAIAGVVRDTTGAVLPGVTVEAGSPALIEKVRTVLTDAEGQYKIVELGPGTYSVTFTLAGFTTVKREGIALTTGFTASANANMAVGSVTETITVSGASPVVDIQNVRTQNVLSRETLDAVPTNKTLAGFTALTVGAVTTSTSAGSQDVGGNKGETAIALGVHGNRPGDMTMNIDGMKLNNTVANGGGAGRMMFVDQVATQEVVLQTGGLFAENETGGIYINVVPKDGGNGFKFYFNGSYTDANMQNRNLTAELRARGQSEEYSVTKVRDAGAGLGGPIKKDNLWFYTAHRWWGSGEFVPGNYFNLTPNSLFYTPDLSRPAFTRYTDEDHSLRLSWQAAPKHKVNVNFMYQHNCYCNFGVEAFKAPEASTDFWYYPAYQAQTTWSYPATPRLLFEAGAAYNHNRNPNYPTPGTPTGAYNVTEQSTGFVYGSTVTLSGNTDYGLAKSNHFDTRFAVSYVTGSHAVKIGLQTLSGLFSFQSHPFNDVSYTFRNQMPVALTELAVPYNNESREKLGLGLYAQDQWTVRKLTLNLGVRFDSINAYYPAQIRPADRFVGAVAIDERGNLPNWKDVTPRLGAAYDLFGSGKTAIKAAVGRYVLIQGVAIAQALNPVSAVSSSATRTWNDANHDYNPQCDVLNPAANGECGAISNIQFGHVVLVTQYPANYLNGWGLRPYDWQASAAVQHELRPGMAVNLSYFRTWYGNFTVTQNQAVSASSFSSYCVMAPGDPRLPGGGNQICGLYDVNPTQFGQTNNLVTLASDFGNQTEVFNGIDGTVNARFGKGGVLQGGIGTGRTVTDNCYQNSFPNLTASGYVAGTPRTAAFCRVTLPWSAQTQVKFAGVYPLPWDTQVSAVFQNLPGIPVQANTVFTNAQIVSSLGRNLAACPATGTCTAAATIPVITPNTVFEDRRTQVDVRLTKIFQMGKVRVQGRFDVFNLFNTSGILAENLTYGPSWLRPIGILGARLYKVGGQVDF